MLYRYVYFIKFLLLFEQIFANWPVPGSPLAYFALSASVLVLLQAGFLEVISGWHLFMSVLFSFWHIWLMSLRQRRILNSLIQR